jgi:hypothetical protein
MYRILFTAFIALAVFGCNSSDALRDVGKVAITNKSPRAVEVKSLEIGDSTLMKNVAPSSTEEEFFVCEKRGILPEKCVIRWQLQDPKEDSKEMVIDLRALNKSPLGGYMLTFDSSFTWSVSPLPRP